MAKSVGARVNEELYDWLTEQAEKEKTTRARILEDLIMAEYRKKEESTESAKIALEEVPQLKDIEEEPYIETGSREVAQEIREELSQWIAASDDARLNDVRFIEGVPDDVLIKAREIQLDHMQADA